MVINKITIRGTITSSRMTSTTRVIYEIATDGDIGKSVFPEVVQMVKGPDEVFCVGEHVTAYCHARSGKKTDDEGKPIYFKQIVADRLARTERILRRYLDDIPAKGEIPEDINEFVFCGEVYRVIRNPGGKDMAMVTLKIQENEKYANYVEVVGFSHKADIIKNAETGDTLAVAGSVRTMYRDHRVLFNYVAKDLHLKKKEKDG